MSDKLDLKTPDMVNLNIERIAALFPHCVTETNVETPHGTSLRRQIDFDLLRQELSADIVEGPKERYRLEWPGKREAIVTANMPTTNTLRPVREDSVNFDTTENLYIEGDNLEVLKLLQESYLGKIKMIDIDPPYNTGNDFVYRDNFAQDSDEYKADSGMTDELGNRLVANPETAGRYHSDWLTMMYPRLKLARNLLTDDGLIFIHIGDDEVHNLRKICDEIFGEVGFAASFIWKRRQNVDSRSKTGVSVDHEYCLVYKKQDYGRIRGAEKDMTKYSNPDNDPRGDWMSADMTGLATKDQRPNLHYDLIDENSGKKYLCPPTGWRYEPKRMKELVRNNEVIFPKNDDGRPRRKKFANDLTDEFTGFSTSLNTVFNTQGTRELRDIFDGEEYFDFPKPKELIQILIKQGTNVNEDSIILDFFSGSATTAHAVMQLNAEDGGNRKFIMVQLPEKTDEKSEAYKAGYKNICEIGKERIRRAGAKIKAQTTPAPQPPKGTAPQPPKGGVESGSLSLFGTDNVASDGVTPSHPVTKTQNSKLDIGFRVYRLDTSNMQDVYYRPQDYKQQTVMNFANHIKPDRTADDLVAQVMLDWGLPLSLPIEQTTIAGKTVYKVAGNALYCCFDEGIDEEFVRAMVSPTTDGVTPSHPVSKALPLRIVFHDYAFANDTAKENVRQLLKQLSGETEMRVI